MNAIIDLLQLQLKKYHGSAAIPSLRLRDEPNGIGKLKKNYSQISQFLLQNEFLPIPVINLKKNRLW